MNTTKLDRNMWQVYLLDRADLVRHSTCEVHVMDLERDQMLETWGARLTALLFDEETGKLRVLGTDDCAHTVHDVQSLSVVEDHTGALTAVEAVDGDGIQHVLQLKVPKGLAG